MLFTTTLLASLALPLVHAHGQVRSFITSTTTYPAADAYASSPDPNSPIRKLNTYGPAAPFTGADITCGVRFICIGFEWVEADEIGDCSLVGITPRRSLHLSWRGVALRLIGERGRLRAFSSCRRVVFLTRGRHPGKPHPSWLMSRSTLL